MTDYLEFNIEEIHRIAAATKGHQAQWDQIWNTAQARLSGLVANALDGQTGGFLEHRSAEYHRKTTAYNQELLKQQTAIAKVGHIAAGAHANMTRSIAGGQSV